MFGDDGGFKDSAKKGAAAIAVVGLLATVNFSLDKRAKLFEDEDQESSIQKRKPASVKKKKEKKAKFNRNKNKVKKAKPKFTDNKSKVIKPVQREQEEYVSNKEPLPADNSYNYNDVDSSASNAPLNIVSSGPQDSGSYEPPSSGSSGSGSSDSGDDSGFGDSGSDSTGTTDTGTDGGDGGAIVSDNDTGDNGNDADTGTDGDTTDAPTTGGTTPTPGSTFALAIDKSEGVYPTNPSLTISLNEAGTIHYCTASGGLVAGECCTVDTTSPTTATFTIGAGDGGYCMSTYAVSDSGVTTPSQHLVYTVDSSVPDLNVSTTQYLQTTEIFNFQISSAEIGTPGYYYSQRVANSSSAVTCSDIDTTFPYIFNPAGGPTLPYIQDFSLISTTFDIVASFPWTTSMTYGTGAPNYVYSMLENRNFADPSSYPCTIRSASVYLNDFQIFQGKSSGSTAINGNGQMPFTGDFSSYGFFRGPASLSATITSGGGADSSSPANILESNFVNIAH